MSKIPECDENWHIFNGGLPKPGDVCKCGQKQSTVNRSVLIDAPGVETDEEA